MALSPEKFDVYKQHISLLNGLEVTKMQVEYICPFCLRQFTSTQLDELSEEHAPQNALGGKIMAVTCRECNNGYGGNIDRDLKTFVSRHEFNIGIPDAEVEYEIEPGLHGLLSHNDEGDVLFKINCKKCNPEKAAQFLADTGKGTVVDGKIKLLKNYNANFAAAGLYKSAYIILFKHTGYNFLLDKHYQPLRDKIEHPNNTFPRLYSPTAPEGVPDGVYLCVEDDFKGFFIVLTLRLKAENRFTVLIPAPSYTFEQTEEFAKTIVANRHIKCQSLLNDCIANADDIIRLHKLLAP